MFHFKIIVKGEGIEGWNNNIKCSNVIIIKPNIRLEIKILIIIVMSKLMVVEVNQGSHE